MTTLEASPAAARSHRAGTLGVTAIGTALLTALADWLFYGEPIGWTAGLFTLALLAAVIARRPGMVRRGAGAVIALATALLALAMVESPGGLEFTLAGLGLVSLSLIAAGGWTDRPLRWVREWVRFGLVGWTRFVRDGNRWLAAMVRRRVESQSSLSVLLGTGRGVLRVAAWVVPIALGGVFVLLFAWANPVIDRWVTQTLRSVEDFLSQIEVMRLLFWACVAVWVWALLRAMPSRGRRRSAVDIEEPGAGGEPLLPAGFVVRCLVVFNLVFAVQTTLDLMYLAGGVTLPAGMTYKEYAHRGAYPLVATALLAAVFVLVTFGRGSGSPRMRWARRLVYVWIAQNVLLMGSTVWRVYLLVSSSMITRWRVAAAVWLAVLGVGFVLAIVRIVRNRSNLWLTRRVALLALAVMFGFSFVPVDGFIADFNVAHCREMSPGGGGGPFYVPYHESLGFEALPAMRRLLPKMSGRGRAELAEAIRRVEAQLARDQGRWRSWTWRGARMVKR